MRVELEWCDLKPLRLGLAVLSVGQRVRLRVSGEKRAEDVLPSWRSMQSLTVKETALGLRSGGFASKGETTKSSCASRKQVSRGIERHFCAKGAGAKRQFARLKSGLERNTAIRMRRGRGNALRRWSGEISWEKRRRERSKETIRTPGALGHASGRSSILLLRGSCWAVRPEAEFFEKPSPQP
jgi:hypothetical protein